MVNDDRDNSYVTKKKKIFINNIDSFIIDDILEQIARRNGTTMIKQKKKVRKKK